MEFIGSWNMKGARVKLFWQSDRKEKGRHACYIYEGNNFFVTSATFAIVTRHI